jgi:hypothetical protein
MQKLRVDARRVQVDAIDLHCKREIAVLSSADRCCTNESFLVWLDSSFLRLGPLIFQAGARREGWPPFGGYPLGLGLD